MTDLKDKIKSIEDRASREIAEATAAALRKAAIRAEVARVNAETARLADELMTRLEDEYGVANHPKAGALWRIAWDRGHSGGLSDVESNYSELVELIK